MDAYIEQVMDKLTDLQQQTRFCINNYDYYHKNNELEVLRRKEKKLRISSNYITGFLNTLSELQNTIKEGNSRCDEVDILLAKCSSVNNHKDDGERDSNKENV